MTVPVSNAWFPLGGHNQGMTAHSSLTPPQPEAWVNQQQAAAHMQMQQAQAQAQEAGQIAAQHFYGSSAALGLQTVAYSTAGFAPIGQAAPRVTPVSTEATVRSMELLYDWMTPEQRRQWATANFFEVIGGDTGKLYRIYSPSPYNIHELNSGSTETFRKICFVPKDQDLPKGDILLCQKLALELDETATLAIANYQSYRIY